MSEQLRFDSQQSKTLISSPKHRDQFLGPHTLIFNEYVCLPLEVQWVRHEADHSPPSWAKVKNEWSYNSLPPYAFMVCNFTFTSVYMFWHSSATFMVLNT
jgi:hypothetical protein